MIDFYKKILWKKTMIKIFFYIFSLHIKLALTEKNCTDYKNQYDQNPYYTNRLNQKNNETFSLFSNFNEFNDLILECNQTYNITQYVIMNPKKSLIVDETFQLKKILNQTQINSIEYLDIGNVKGIDLNSKSFILDSNRFKQRIFLRILSSKFNVYFNSIKISSDKCDLATYNTSANFLKYYYSIAFKNVIYPSKWCPYFFRNFDLVKLGHYGITNSFLIKNRLIFYQLNSSQVYLDYLSVLILEITYENLNRDNLSPDLFRKIEHLGITGILCSIEFDLFKEFKNLKVVDFVLNNLREFFHTRNEWMNYLNLNTSNKWTNDVKKAIRLEYRHLSNFVSFDSIYEYPNEDLCLFKDFPHERSVYPLLMPGKRLECTCTLFWLQKNLDRYKTEIIITYEYSSNETYNLVKVFKFCDYSFNVSDCDFEKRFNTCQIIDINNAKHKLSFDNDFDILYVIKFLEFILLVIMAPIFGFIGIGHNVLTILVIRNKNMKREFQEPMYKHAVINAIFNILYCVIMVLKLINTCIFYGPSVFCSNVYQEEWAQNFKIILVHYLGNVTRMCSNFSYLIFSLSRLLLITKQKDGHLTNRTRSHKNIHFFFYFYVFAIVSFNCLFSLFKLFQYRKNALFNMGLEFPFEIRDEEYCNNEKNKFQCQLFNAFKIANRSINDILFLVLNMLIDFILLIKFQRYMNSKLRQINDLTQRNSIEKSKKHLNHMIFFNGFIYIFSHLPEFIMTLLLIIYSKKVANFCNYKFSCDLLNEEAEFFSLISIVCQFYVFKIFDKHFKRSFDELKSNIFQLIFRLKNA